ncbi:MAG: dipeptide ABC transporter ATP-binding protein [Alphaproteobacteria bacterium]
MTVLQIDDLTITFRTRKKDYPQAVLDGVSLDLDQGETLGLVGESGSGKSMLCLSLLGLLPRGVGIEGGRLVFTDPARAGGHGEEASVDLARLSDAALRTIRGRRIAMIFQEPMTAFSPVHTIGGQIREICRAHQGCDDLEAHERTLDMLDQVGLKDPAGISRQYAFELSGGMRQRAMIAMAMICQPAVLVADEPTTALDVTTQAGILKLIRTMQDRTGMAILLVTHDVGVVASIADQMGVLHRGRLMERGRAGRILTVPGHPYTQSLMTAVPRCDRRAGSAGAGPQQGSAPALVTLDGVSACYGEAASTLEDISLDIRCGECLGLVGESGSGKSTLARVIMGALVPSSGALRFHAPGGPPVDPASLAGADLKSFRRRIHYVFQDPASALIPRHTLRDILREPLVIHGLAKGREAETRVLKAMDLVGLPRTALDRFPHAFSGGQRQRIGIARALMTATDLVLVDEPTSALDVSVQAQILALLKRLRGELGLTYLFISHNLAVIQAVADRIAVMCRGRIVELAAGADLFCAARHPYTRTLLDAVPDALHPLDLDAPGLGEPTDPALWPRPYRPDADTPARFLEAAAGHWVLQAETPDAPHTVHPSSNS